MEKIDELKITVESGVKELQIRTGKVLPDPELPNKLTLNGTLNSPSNFVKLRKAEIDPKTTHVIFSKQKGIISLVVDEKFNRGAVVTGKLEVNPELKNFGINESKFYSHFDLASFLKMQRVYFVDSSEHLKVITELNKFKGKIHTEFEKEKDLRGNSKNHYERVVESSVPMGFALNIPIFLGYPTVKFTVEICFDAQDATIRFWLESVDLHELMLSFRDKVFEEELKSFSDYVVIEQ